MNKQPSEQGRDSDLRLSNTALLRTAQRARELAQKTCTAIVISRNGVVEYLKPEAANMLHGVQQSLAPYVVKI